MILRNATIKYTNYDPNDLKPYSTKRICVVCDRCERVRWVTKAGYRKLCHSCSLIKRWEDTNEIEKQSTRMKRRFKDPKECEKCTSLGMMDKKHTCLSKEKMKESRIKFCINNPGWNSGEDNPMWEGGISFDPYCEKFNSIKKKEIRDNYGNCDYLTGIHRDICNRMKSGKIQELSIHHVDFNKQQGCGNIPWKLVPVSRKHNSMFNKNRSFWKKLILYSLEYDKDYYNGYNFGTKI